MFQFILTTPALAMFRKLKIPKNGAITKAKMFIVFFVISGALHAAGSYTIWGPTKTFDSFLFSVQSAGIIIQLLGSWSLGRLHLRKKIPAPMHKAAEVTFRTYWFVKTFSLPTDDYVRGELWLTDRFRMSVSQLSKLGTTARASLLS